MFIEIWHDIGTRGRNTLRREQRVLNLFANTKFNHAEEDRLTNAFMLVLANVEWSVQESLLSLMGLPREYLCKEDRPKIELQVVFDHSRPDAQIKISDYTIVIETKLGSALDDDQFRRHWAYLEDTQSQTILLSLTKAFMAPDIVKKLESNSVNPALSLRHLSWSTVLHTVRTLKAEYPTHSLTFFLLGHFEVYLDKLGYYAYEGSIVDKLKNYGELLRALHDVQSATESQLAGHLSLLKEGMEGHRPLLSLNWETRNFGKDAITDQNVHFSFLTADVSGFSWLKFRIVPSMSIEGELSLRTYMTYNHKKGKNLPLLNWLIKTEAKNRKRFEPLQTYGLLPHNAHLFHISRLYSGTEAAAFFEGDAAQIAKLGEHIGVFFTAITHLLDEFRQNMSSADTI